MKKFILIITVILSSYANLFAQDDYTPKEIKFDIFKFRHYEQKGQFDAAKAFKFLFPGNIIKYKSSENKIILKSCWYLKYVFTVDSKNRKVRKIITKDYIDKSSSEAYLRVSEILGDLDYKDGKNKYKYLFFNTGPEPQYACRFCEGDLGFAKFKKNEDKWVLVEFDPEIASFGYFGCSTMPYKILKISEKTTVFYIKKINDTGAGYGDYNPLNIHNFILMKKGSSYIRIFDEIELGCMNGFKDAGGTEWDADVKVVTNHKSVDSL